MAGYNGKHTGAEIDNAIDKISSGGSSSGGGITPLNVTIESYYDDDSGEETFSLVAPSRSELGAMVQQWIDSVSSDEYEEGAFNSQWYVSIVGGSGTLNVTYVPVKITRNDSSIDLQCVYYDGGSPVIIDITITTSGNVTANTNYA